MRKLTCFLCGEQGYKVFNCPKNLHTAKCMQENQVQEHLLICEDAESDIVSQQKYDVFCEDTWIADSGATSHMTNNGDGMCDIVEYNSSVKVGNGKNISITHKGKHDVLIQKDGKQYFSILTNVKVIPELGHSLFSIQSLLMKEWMTSSEKANNPIDQIPKIVHDKMNDVKFDRIVRAGDSVLTGLKMIRRPHYNNLTADQRRTINRDKGHAMLGHCNENVGNTTAKMMGIVLSGQQQNVNIVQLKHKKKYSQYVENKIEIPGELMYLDISSMKQASGGGNRHWILLVDRPTDFKISWFVKKKSDQIEVVSKYISNLKASNNIQVKNMRLDNSGENKALEQECLRLGLGIQFEYTAPGTPQQYGVVERSFPTLMGRARAMMGKAGLTGEMRTRMWCEPASTATKLSNIIVKTNETKSSYAKFYNKKTKYAHNLRIFGEIVVAKNISTRLTKWSLEGMCVCLLVMQKTTHMMSSDL